MASRESGSAGHRARLRRRFLASPRSMPTYEVLELLLAQVLPRVDTKPLARELLDRFGSLPGVLDAHPAERSTVSGVGPALEAHLTLVREIIARYLEGTVKKRKAVTLYDVGQIGRSRLAGCPREEVWAALLDNGNRLLTFEKVCSGSVDQVFISPRDVVELALTHKASAVVLLHNHPGGSGPSTLDIEATRHLRQAVTAVGIRFVDHLILRDGEIYSLTQDHLLE